MTKAEKELILNIVGSNMYTSEVKKCINAIPVTDDSPKNGTWGRPNYIDTLSASGDRYMIREVRCSNCRGKVQLLDYDNFCPRCGSNNAFHD